MRPVTCQVRPLVDVRQGVAVLEAELLVQIISSSSFSANTELGVISFSSRQPLKTHDFLCDWLMAIGVEGVEGEAGPKAEFLLISSPLSRSPSWPSSSTIPSTQPPGIDWVRES